MTNKENVLNSLYPYTRVEVGHLNVFLLFQLMKIPLNFIQPAAEDQDQRYVS